MSKITYKLASILISLCLSASSCSKTPPQAAEPSPIIQTSQLPQGWYSHDASELNKELDTYFALAQEYFPVPVQNSQIKALIAPHAGYYYSGLCACSVYQTLLAHSTNTPLDERKNKTIKRVIILAPSHTTFYNGIALPEYTIFRTVLGDIPVDWQALKTLNNNGSFKTYQFAHTKEHSVEMQLPLLQKTIQEFSIVPLIVGHMNTQDTFIAAKLLKKIIDDTTLIVVSSDFVHHGKNYDYTIFDQNILDHVRVLDSLATQSISMQSRAEFQELLGTTNATICGQEPIKILLTLLEMQTLKNVQAQACCYYTSAHLAQARRNSPGIDVKKLFTDVPDTAAQNSVSYLGIVFAQPAKSLTGYEQQSLLTLARKTLENSFKQEQEKLAEHLLFPIASTKLLQSAGAFVTLHTKDGHLRGCVGRITTDDPLYSTVHDMSLAAAFQDSRFAPLAKHELENIRIEVSILTKPVLIESYQNILLGRDGIILNKHDAEGKDIASSVFLPQVPKDFGWDLETTLEQLSLKAGLDRDAWKLDCSFQVFESITMEEASADPLLKE